MKSLGILVFAILVGCSSSPTLLELEDEALRTGDWSAVEQRERALARRRGHLAPACPDGFSKACYEFGMKTECKCVMATPRVVIHRN